MLPLVGHVLVHQVAVVLNHMLQKVQSENMFSEEALNLSSHLEQRQFEFLLGSTDWQRGRPASLGCPGAGQEEAGPAIT